MTTNSHQATTVHRSPADLAMRWFPLLPRRKPACPPLIDRIGRVRLVADLAGQRTDGSLLRAAEAHNLAALILSDCAMPTPARNLCWRQFDIFTTAGPYDQATAKLALQPLVNLGRLDTRDGNGTAAYQLHHTMFQAAKTRTTANIDGRQVDFAKIVRPGDDHTAIVQWLWTILLADGLRALCRAGRWSQALAQAERHHGIGERLLDGRQIAIISHSTTGDHTKALRLVDTTTTPTAWEQAVSACMKVLCRTWAGRSPSIASAAMRDAYLQLEPDPEHTVFHIRLGLTVASLATDNSDVRSVTQMIERIAVETADAYAAHDILAVGRQLPITEPTVRALRETVRAAGLGTTMSAQLLDDLMLAVQDSERWLIHALGGREGQHPTRHAKAGDTC